MKITLLCNSLLLEETLKSYLNDKIVPYEYAEFIISDKKISTQKPLFLISHSRDSNLKIPFTKAELFWAIEEFYLSLLEREVSLRDSEDIRPILKEINKKHYKKIAKLAKKIV